MGIKKESAATLRKIGMFYTTVPSDTVKNINDPVALAIWVYLQSQSDGFIIRASYLQDHFSLSRERYRKAILYLKNMRLIKKCIEHGERGKIVDNFIECHALPFESIGISTESTENRILGENITAESTENTTVGKNDGRCFRPLIKYQRNSLIKKQEREESKTSLSESSKKLSTPEPTLAEKVVEMLHRKMITGVPTPGDPKLQAYLDAGLTYEEIEASAEWCVQNKKTSFGYVMKRAEGRRKDAQEVDKQAKTTKPMPPYPRHQENGLNRPKTPNEDEPIHPSHKPFEPIEIKKPSKKAIESLEEARKMISKSFFGCDNIMFC